MAGFKQSRAKAQPKMESLGSVDEALRNVVGVLNSHDDEIQKLNGGLTLGQNTVGIVKALSFRLPSDPPFVALTLDTGWSASNPALQYLMMPGGQVILRGGAAATGGGAYAGGVATPIAFGTMPAGYWPIGVVAPPAHAILAGGAGSSWLISAVSTAGVLTAFAAAGNITGAIFDGVSWFVTDAAPPHQFVGPGWPLRVRHDFETRCKGLVVLGFRRQAQTGQNVGQGAPVVDWQDLGDGTLRINGVWGLQWGQRYDLELYLTPEDEKE